MTTEIFGALIICTIALLFIVAIIVIDRYRHPEIYLKKHQPKKRNKNFRKKHSK